VWRTRSSTPGPSELEPIVLVDARNVIRSRWPNLREESFVELARAWADREGVQTLLVFDGPAPDGRVGDQRVDERTTIVGTGRGSADDWIADEAPRLADGGRRIWAVTSDRALRGRIEPYVSRVVGGGSFATLLESL
jgi:YacP-like NYN domain